MRAARIWRPETMLLISRIYIRFWKRRHRPPCFILSDGHMLVRRPTIAAAPMPLPRWCDFAERRLWNIWPGSRGSLRLDAGGLDHLGPLLGIACDKFAEVGRRTHHHCAAQIGKPHP